MALRSLLGLIEEDASAQRLAREGGHAFVSSSLRPYAIAALADSGPAERARPTLVVVGDDRAARDMAADLRAWLAPRRVRYYPSRGVAYESHLAPPPHLVGLRVAALDALLAAKDAEAEPPVVVVSAVALSEKVPDPALRPHSFTLRVGELLDLDECAAELVAAGYERVEQVEERGQFALRGGLLGRVPGDRGARGAGRHVRRGDRVAALVLDVHAALARGCRGGRDRARGRARGRAPRAGGDRRAGGCRRTARTSPSCCRSSASARCSTCSARTRSCWSPPRRSSRRR